MMKIFHITLVKRDIQTIASLQVNILAAFILFIHYLTVREIQEFVSFLARRILNLACKQKILRLIY